MKNTYTFIARSAVDALRVATFTLHGDRMSIGIGAPMEQVEKLIGGEPEKADQDAPALDNGRPWMRPLLVSLLERRSTPFHIRDVEVSRSNGGLRVSIWTRVAGLRLAPVVFRWDEVDNPAAADDFLREVEDRQDEARSVRKFVGFLDYWLSWIVGVFAVVLLVNQQRGRST